MSAPGGKADEFKAEADILFVMSASGGIADAFAHQSERLLIANNGHSLVPKSGPLKGWNRPKSVIQAR